MFASLGATVGRSRLMRLSGQAEVKRHADQGYYWTERVRVHVPVVTQPTVRFECGDAAINMAAGECWIFDTWRQHRVLNDAVESRVHLVVDTVGGGGFWDLVGRGRPHDAPRGGLAAAARWRRKPGVVATFACETVNVPAVMTPWELEQRISACCSPMRCRIRTWRRSGIATQLRADLAGAVVRSYGDRPEGHAQLPRRLLEALHRRDRRRRASRWC